MTWSGMASVVIVIAASCHYLPAVAHRMASSLAEFDREMCVSEEDSTYSSTDIPSSRADV